MRSFIIAVQFLTRIPLAPKMTVSDEDVGRSMGYFPLVGLCMGACLAAAHLLFATVLPRGVTDGLIVALLAALSGAIHLDGLADTADGIAGGKDREERLRIMKDPRIGAIGAVCVVLLIMLKYVALAALPGKLTYRALLLVPMIGRWVQVLVAYRSDYAGLSRAIGSGLFNTGDPVLVINTGSGLKDVRAAMQAVREAPVIPPSLDAVRKLIG